MRGRIQATMATLAVLVAAMLGLSASPAGAVIGGTFDRTNKFSNVGLSFIDGQPGAAARCTGPTALRPRVC